MFARHSQGPLPVLKRSHQRHAAQKSLQNSSSREKRGSACPASRHLRRPSAIHALTLVRLHARCGLRAARARAAPQRARAPSRCVAALFLCLHTSSASLAAAVLPPVAARKTSAAAWSRRSVAGGPERSARCSGTSPVGAAGGSARSFFCGRFGDAPPSASPPPAQQRAARRTRRRATRPSSAPPALARAW